MTQVPLTPAEQADQLQRGVPQVMQALSRYVPYQLRMRPSGRQGKVPVRVDQRTQRCWPVDVRDPRHHLTFGDALTLLRTGTVDGTGLALDERIPAVDGLPLCAVDLDDVLDDGVLRDDARRLVETLDSWTEVSQSGAGLHVIAAGRLLPRGRRGQVELITSGFLALTGAHWPGTPMGVQVREPQLRALHTQQIGAPTPQAPRDVVLAGVDDEAVLRRLERARNGQKFLALFNGNLQYHGGDASRADLALLRMVLWATRDPAQVMRLWQRSALYRPERWAQPCRRRGERTLTYAEATLQRAFELAQ